MPQKSPVAMTAQQTYKKVMDELYKDIKMKMEFNDDHEEIHVAIACAA